MCVYCPCVLMVERCTHSCHGTRQLSLTYDLISKLVTMGGEHCIGMCACIHRA